MLCRVARGSRTLLRIPCIGLSSLSSSAEIDILRARVAELELEAKEGCKKSLKLMRAEGDINLTPEREAWQRANLDEATRELLAEDAKYFLHQALSTPCLNALEKCEGIYLQDMQGKKIMDFHGNSVHQVGFANPAVIAAIKHQLDELPFCTRRYTNRPAVALAKKLAELAPGDLSRTLLCPGGTSAVGIALKLARMHTGRFKTISMWESFHGASLDAISVGGEEIFRGNNVGPLLPGSEHVPPCDEFRCQFKCQDRGGCDMACADYVEYVLETEGDISAVIAEPIRWTPYVPKREYWERVRTACDKHGALLIFDEIPNSLGRTGRMFTCENYVVPDILVLGKGLGGGVLPLAAIVAREHLNEAGRAVALGHYTHEKNPVACAAALATIKYIEDHGLCANATARGDQAQRRLRAAMPRYKLIGDVRGLGLLVGVELVTKGRGRAMDEAEKVMYGCLTRGLSFKLTMGNIVTLVPPLTITEVEMDSAIDILLEVIAEVEAASPNM